MMKNFVIFLILQTITARPKCNPDANYVNNFRDNFDNRSDIDKLANAKAELDDNNFQSTEVTSLSMNRGNIIKQNECITLETNRTDDIVTNSLYDKLNSRTRNVIQQLVGAGDLDESVIENRINMVAIITLQGID